MTGGIGFSSCGAPFEEGSESYYGAGIALGGGYEFSKHWSVKGNFTWGNPEHVSALAFRFTVNALAY